MRNRFQALLLQLAQKLRQIFLIESAASEFLSELCVHADFFKDILKVFLDSQESGCALLELGIEDLTLLLMMVELRLQILVQLITIIVIGRPLEVHLLYLHLLALDSLLEFFHLRRYLIDEILHNEVLLVEGEKCGQEVFAISRIAAADLLLQSFEAPLDLLFFLETLLVLLVNSEILLFLELYV